MALTRNEDGWVMPPDGVFGEWLKFLVRVIILPGFVAGVIWINSVERRFLAMDLTRWKDSDHEEYAETVRLEQQAVRLQLQAILGMLEQKVDKDAAPPPDYQELINHRFAEIDRRLRRLEGTATDE